MVGGHIYVEECEGCQQLRREKAGLYALLLRAVRLSELPCGAAVRVRGVRSFKVSDPCEVDGQVVMYTGFSDDPVPLAEVGVEEEVGGNSQHLSRVEVARAVGMERRS